MQELETVQQFTCKNWFFVMNFEERVRNCVWKLFFAIIIFRWYGYHEGQKINYNTLKKKKYCCNFIFYIEYTYAHVKKIVSKN